jgi:DNA-binding beta-propeller fold protein YncE
LAATSDRVYVVDWQNDRVEIFTSGGEYVDKWGYPGTAPGEFHEPIHVALGSGGAVYVTDLLNNRIQEFSDVATSTVHMSWGALKARYR